MKFFKILPAAAGVIALTATVSFARDQRECEEDGFCRTIIVVRDSGASANNTTPNNLAPALDKQGDNVYQVEVQRGSKSKLVTIDAYSGKVLGNSESPEKSV